MEHLGMPPLAHGTAELEPGVRLHYVTAGTGTRTMVLLHGYPETWYEWRHVIGPLVRAGWRVVAPDYRGAGDSSKPTGGYDKRTMAADIFKLLRNHLKISGQVTVVGHDIGMMVAYAFASDYPKSVDKLVLMEAPLPGTAVYDATVASTKLNNFASGTSFSTMPRTTWLSRLQRDANVSTFSISFSAWPLIRTRSQPLILTFTLHSSPLQAQCERGLRSTGPSTGMLKTTRQPSRRTVV